MDQQRRACNPDGGQPVSCDSDEATKDEQWALGWGGRSGCAQGTAACLVVLLVLLSSFSLAWPACAADDHESGAGLQLQSEAKRPDEAGSTPAAVREKPSDEYGNVTAEEAGAEGPRIADPVEPWNRAMYHFNDKFYFWVAKPATKVYKARPARRLQGSDQQFLPKRKGARSYRQQRAARQAEVRRARAEPVPHQLHHRRGRFKRLRD